MNRKVLFKGILFLLFIGVIYVACKKDSSPRKSRLTPEFKAAIEKVGRLHNSGLTKAIKDHPEWAKYWQGEFGTAKVSSFGAGFSSNKKRTLDYWGTWEGITVTRSYFVQFTIDSLPEYTFPLAVLDTLATYDNDYWLEPDSAIVSRINANSPITLSSYFNYLTQELFDAIGESDYLSDFNDKLDLLLANADYNLESDFEFYVYALGVAVAKQSAAYWNNSDNMDAWNNYLNDEDNNPLSMNVQNKRKPTLLFLQNQTPVDKIIHADIGGALGGAIIGGFIGAAGGPPGTLAGIIGGGLTQGARSSFSAAAKQLLKHWLSKQ